MQRFAGRPPGTLWVPAFVVYAEGFSPAARMMRRPVATGLKPAARVTKPYGLGLWRAKTGITPCVLWKFADFDRFRYTAGAHPQD